jgi:hypothetical protein
MAEKKKKKPRPDADDSSRDPLGKPLARYSTTFKAVMLIIVAVVLGLSGGGVLGGSKALAEYLAESQEDTAYVFVGWGFILVGMPVIAYGVFGLGRSFEVRRKGVRFRDHGTVTELLWDEISQIDVHKNDIYYRGAKTGERWEVFIHGGRDTIHLSPIFLKMVPSVRELANLLKMHCRQEVTLPGIY